jgi:hypothetical protein
MKHVSRKISLTDNWIVTPAALFLLCAVMATATMAAENPIKAVMTNISSKAVGERQNKESNGILVERVSLSASGIMVDVRYRITNLEKAQKVLNRSSRLQMVDQKTKAILPVPDTPKVGKLRQIPKTDEPARIYWMFFRNTGGVARLGSKLTLNMGDASIKDLLVE